MLKRAVVLMVLLQLTLLSPAGLAAPAAVLGQVVSRAVHLDGFSVPPGTTVWAGSTLQTGPEPAVVHLSVGSAFQLDRNSKAVVESLPGGEVRTRVLAGTVSYRHSSNRIGTVPAGSEVTFSQRQEGQPVASTPDASTPEGAVAVLTEEGAVGKAEVTVNDISRINASLPVLIQSPDAKTRAIHHIKQIGPGNVVVWTAPLETAFPAQSVLIQGDNVAALIAAGTVAVVGSAAAVGAAAGAGAAVGVGVGVGAGAGAAAGLSTAVIVGVAAAAVAAGAITVGTLVTGEEEPPSPSTPQ